MFGIYLYVEQDGESKSDVPQDLFQGRQRLTLAQIGKQPEHEALAARCVEGISYVGKKITLDSVVLVPAMRGKVMLRRLRVLLMASSADTQMIEATRRSIFSSEEAERVTMQAPHVTVATFDNVEETETYVRSLQSMLPLSVTVTGIGIQRRGDKR